MKIINNEEYYSIQDIANEIGIYKLKVQRYIHDHKNDYESIQYRNSIVFDTTTKNAIITDFLKVHGDSIKAKNESDSIQSEEKNESETIQNENIETDSIQKENAEPLQNAIESLQKEYIESLKATIQEKNQQLLEKDEQIRSITKLLDQEQKLHLATQQKLLLLEQKEEPTETDREPQKEPTQSDTVSEQVNIQEKKLSFTERLRVLFKGEL